MVAWFFRLRIRSYLALACFFDGDASSARLLNVFAVPHKGIELSPSIMTEYVIR